MAAQAVIKISTSTLRDLEYLKRLWGARSIDETIRKLRKELPREAIDKLFGIDKGKLTPFTEEDRWEDRD